MNFFKKKYNIKKDYLRKRFDPNKREYYYTKIIEGKEHIIPFEDLDRNSKKTLLEYNKQLLTDLELLNEEINKYNELIRREYLQSIGYTCNSFKTLEDVKGTASRKMEEYLDNLLSEENVLVGLHRVGSEFNKNTLNDIFTNGLKITGHMGGAVLSKKVLRNSVSYYPTNKTVKKELMCANEYKNSLGSILIKIPDIELEKNEDIYLINGTEVRLNPKYIIGYVPVYPNHHIENIISNQNFYENNNEINKRI